MDLKLFKKYIELCTELNKEPNWKDLKAFKWIFA
ncbi:hypothetical protein JOC62_002022 [Clostridium sardiniense]|nr:hypothetical protein [Clostridium sardiniense]